jgi:succinate dehydrogenase/fumarate reductase flavoprotein subunit
MYTHHEMLDLVVADGVARGIVVRDLMSGKIRTSRRTRCCCARAGTATCSTCRRTRRTRTRRRSGGRTSAARCSPTRATRRSTRPASR